MSMYILNNKEYNVFPKLESQVDSNIISPQQLQKIENFMSEFFGCFMVFGMGFDGTPKMIMSGASGMEQLAMKKFIEDIILGEAEFEFLSTDEEEFGEDSEIK